MDLTDPYCKISDWHKLMRVNFDSPVQIINALVPQMKKKKLGKNS